MQPHPRTTSRHDEAGRHDEAATAAPAPAPLAAARRRALRSGPTTTTAAAPSHPRSSAVERIAAVAGGTALLAWAARHRSWRAVGFALAGAPLVYRGVSGRWPLPEGIAERASQAIALQPVTIETSMTVNRSAADLYAFWHKLPNLPRFMKNLEVVEEEGDGHSRWVARSPLGRKLEWEAEVVEDRPDTLLSWRSLPGSQVETAGSVLFEPATGGRGTVVRVTMELRPAVGKALGRMLGPMARQQVREDLRRFKSLMEAGEVPTIEGQPAGKRARLHLHNPI